jgi:septal ring factor EnvC (AmiA/AmiB activator)
VWRVLALLILLAFTASASAQSTEAQRKKQEAETAQRLDRLRSQIRTLSAERRALDNERGSMVAALRAADDEVAALNRALRKSEAALATQESELARLETQRAALNQSLGVQRSALSALLRSSYALGRHQQLKLLLAQDHVADLSRVLAYHRYVQVDRLDRIHGLISELDALRELGRRVDATRDLLNATRLDQQRQLAQLETQREQRRTLVAGLDRRYRDTSDTIQKLGSDEKAMLALLARLRDVLADVPRQLDDAKPLSSRRGNLSWPLSGTLLSGFGGRLPDGRTGSGWLIAGTAGADVRAIAHGRVAFADWMSGYGLILIIDHGDGWMSLYANNDALLKDGGDWVRAGDPIATVGSSGGQGRPALYFELRSNGKPVDPRSWLRRR